MNQIIQKAIEGEYLYEGKKLWHFSDTNEYRVHLKAITIPLNEYKMLCDPSFWQALGKACGWDKCNDGYRVHICYAKDKWQSTALSFHEINLVGGWDKAVAYLENLIK